MELVGSNLGLLLAAALVAVFAIGGLLDNRSKKSSQSASGNRFWEVSFRQRRDAPDTLGRTSDAPFGILAIAAAAAALVGSFGPWWRVWAVFEFTGASDPFEVRGLWAAGLSAASIVLLAVSLGYQERSVRQKAADLASLTLALAAGIGGLTWYEAMQEAGNDGSGAVGWGLQLLAFGGGVGAVCAFLHSKQA